jgi:hypothetical protein
MLRISRPRCKQRWGAFGKFARPVPWRPARLGRDGAAAQSCRAAAADATGDCATAAGHCAHCIGPFGALVLLQGTCTRPSPQAIVFFELSPPKVPPCVRTARTELEQRTQRAMLPTGALRELHPHVCRLNRHERGSRACFRQSKAATTRSRSGSGGQWKMENKNHARFGRASSY